jgi:dienelactone hydrolase
MRISCLLLVFFLIVPQYIRAEETVPKQRIDIARSMVDLMIQERYDEVVRDFDSTMRTALPPEKVAEVWRQIIGQEQFGGVDTLRAIHTGAYDIVYVRLRVGKALVEAKVVFHGSNQVAGFFIVPVRPGDTYQAPSYADSTLFIERLVTVGESPFILHGRLSVPKGDGPFPCVVLVHGSGPHDKDESIGPNKTFKDLAWGLASRGIAVLRYEKRTLEHNARLFASKDTLTVFTEVIDDACGAIEVARGARNIDPSRVFLLGHSLGATLVPRIAAISKHLAGSILLAGAARPLEDVILDQMEYLLTLGATTDSTTALVERVRRQVEMVKSLALTPTTTTSSLPLSLNASYWLDLRAHNPAREAATLAIPLLLLHGGRDYQVTNADVTLWKSALKSKKNARVIVYPDLNHLFVIGKKKATPEEYDMPGHVAKKVVEEIAAWVKRN